MRSTSRTCRSAAHGFALATALFLVAFLGALAAAITFVAASRSQSTSLDVLSARAYQAARAGVEWAAYRALEQNAACAAPSLSIGGFTVVVACDMATYDEVGTSSVAPRVWQITSTACNATPCPATGVPPATYVERRVSVTLSR